MDLDQNDFEKIIEFLASENFFVDKISALSQLVTDNQTLPF